MRDNFYLRKRLSFIWNKYFQDVCELNPVEISFGRKARKRLGSIKERKYESYRDTLILMNGYFKDEYIPEYVLDATIAHELCHYAHGFGSAHPKLSPFPHRGGIVDREMIDRGLGKLLNQEKKWLDDNWYGYLRQN